MDEQWDINDEDVVECECDRCGEVLPCVYCGNPFVAEIYPDEENEPSWWCRDCFQTIAGDI